jgi:hypothetical protein
VKGKEFGDNMQYISEKENPTVGDMLQILTIAYNLGHFIIPLLLREQL